MLKCKEKGCSVAAAFYYGENLFPEMEYFSLRFTTGSLDLNQDPAVGTGDVVVLDFFSECQGGIIFPKEGEYEIVDMEIEDVNPEGGGCE